MKTSHKNLLPCLIALLFAAGCGTSEVTSVGNPTSELEGDKARFTATLVAALFDVDDPEESLTSALITFNPQPGHEVSHNGDEAGVSTAFNNCDPGAGIIEECAGTDFTGFVVTHTFTNFAITDACGDEIVMTGLITCTQEGRLFNDVSPNRWYNLNAACYTVDAPSSESLAVTFTGGTPDPSDDTNYSMSMNILATGYSGEDAGVLDAMTGTVSFNGSSYAVGLLTDFLDGDGCL